METINLENDNIQKDTLKNQWRSASRRYYEKNKDILKAKKLAHYHHKKQLKTNEVLHTTE